MASSDSLLSNVLTAAALTPAELPQMKPGEAGILIEPRVSLAVESISLAEGAIHITSHRLVWVGQHGGARRAFEIELTRITSVTTPSGFKALFRSNTLQLVLVQGLQATLVFLGQSDPNRFKDTLQQAMQQLPKLAPPPQSAHSQPASSLGLARAGAGETQAQTQPDEELRSLQFIGVRGVMQRQKQELDRSERDIADAFGDLKSLMAKAKDMVALVEVYSSRLAKRSKEKTAAASAASSSDGLSPQQEKEEEESLQRFALSLGISAPVTRDTHGSGSRYLTELARQLVDTLLPALPRYGGMLTLPDAYCLFNRARGTCLVSPEDLVNACEMLATLQLPVAYVVFPSGVKAIQDPAVSLSSVGAIVDDLCATRPTTGISAMDLSTRCGRSAVLCAEQLLALERSGTVCRDDTVDGLFFFPNRFLRC
jgi:ESCRT-II complex subunit VPS36